MEILLRDLPYICVYIDDILVTGTDEQNHLYNLELVLQRLESAGLTLRKSNVFLQQHESLYYYVANTFDLNLFCPQIDFCTCII